MKRGYCRHSKGGPSVNRQIQALIDFGVEERAIYVDKPRRGPIAMQRYKDLTMRYEAIRSLEPGEDDVLVVSSLDRLGRSVSEILEAIAGINALDAAVHDIEEGKTYKWHPDAAEIAKVVAKAEHKLMLERTAKGRRAASKLGSRRGPLPTLRGETLEQAKRMWAEGSLSGREIAEHFGLSLATLNRVLGSRSKARDRSEALDEVVRLGKEIDEESDN